MTRARFRIYNSALVDAAATDVWNEMKDFTRGIAIAFGEGASDVHWIDGGSADIIPARLEFKAHPGAFTVVEEVIARSDEDRSLMYRTVGNVMGIEDYVGTLRYYAITDEPNRTFFEATKEFSLADGIDAAAFLPMYNGLVEQEMKNVKAYFARNAAKNSA